MKTKTFEATIDNIYCRLRRNFLHIFHSHEHSTVSTNDSLTFTNLHFSRNLYKWVERLKSELPYYESCNTGQVSALLLSDNIKILQPELKCLRLGQKARTDPTQPKEIRKTEGEQALKKSMKKIYTHSIKTF